MFVYNAEGFLVKTRVNLGDLLGVAPEKVWVEMREPDTGDLLQISDQLSGASNAKQIEIISGLFPKILVDHNFYESQDKKMSLEAVSTLLKNRSKLTIRATSEYAEKVLFTLLAGEKKISDGSGTSPDPISEAKT